MEDEIKKERERIEKIFRKCMDDIRDLQKEEARVLERFLNDLRRN